MQKYKTLKTLGDGAFGTVYKASNIKTGQIVAIKKMKQKYTTWNQCIELRQVKSLRKLNHPGLIKLKEVLLVAEQLYMYNLYEVYSKMKQQHKKYTQHQIKNIIIQIVGGLANMHKNGFFHRDMKPQNLLIYNNVVKICDLGLAREIRSRPPFTDYVSTRWYRAPQLLLRSTNYNSPVDIFALGCIMAQLYTLSPLFPGNNQVDQLNKIVKILGTPNKNDWPEGYKLAQARGYYFPDQKPISLAQIIPDASLQAIDLIQSMLQYSSRKRPTALQILKHQFFKGIVPPSSESLPKQIIFEEKPVGNKLDTSKQDKNIDLFRATKQKFKQTRKHQAAQNSLFKNQKNLDQRNQRNINNNLDDLDFLIKELQQKGNKKKQKNKLPFINTKQKFNKDYNKKQLRQSKTQMKHGQPYAIIEKQQWRNIRHGQNSSYKYKLPPSKKQQLLPNKFSYGFQPTSLPINLNILPGSKSNNRVGLGLGFLPLSKPNSLSKKNDLFGVNNYKF